jgi:hypothetical protein
MQKSGSGWYFRMANDVMVAAGHDNVRELQKQYPLRLRWLVRRRFRGQIARPNALRMTVLDTIRARGHTFAIKTHRGPSPSVARLMKLGRLRALYQFRDPRDVLLSAFERGERNRGRSARRSVFRLGRYRSFARLRSIDECIAWMQHRLLPVWDAWQQHDNVLLVRYEDLLADTVAELRTLARFIGFDASDEQLQRIDAHYRRKETRDTDPNLHFNKGVAGRFRDTLTPAQLARCKDAIGAHIEKMGYEW